MIEDAERAGRLEARRHRRGADERQHRHRARHGVRGARLPADPHHARRHERGAPAAARALRRRDPPDARHRGHDGRRVRRAGDVPRARRVLHAHAVREPGQPRGAPAHDRAVEILEATDGRLDAFVAAVGTGGTVTGVGEVLKERAARACGSSPSSRRGRPCSPAGASGPHGIQGIGASFVPGVLNRAMLDEIVHVRDEDATAMARRLAREEGLLVGISAGANVWAACQVAAQMPRRPGRRHGAVRYWRALSERRVLRTARPSTHRVEP